MKPRKTWGALALVLAGILALAYWDQRKTSEESKDSKEQKIFDFNAKDITGIDISNSSGSEYAPHIALKKDGNIWSLSEPEVAPADSAAVEMMVNLLADLTYSKIAASGEDRFEAFGVTDSSARNIQLTKANGENIRIWIGAKSPVGYSVYIRHSLKAGDIYLANQHVLSATAKNVNDLKDKTVFRFEKDNIEAIQFGPIGLVKSDGKWSVKNQDSSFSADSQAIETWLSDLIAIKATDMGSKLSKTDKLQELVLTGSGGGIVFKGRAATLIDNVKVVNSDSSLVYTIDNNVKSVFEKKVDDFRQKKLLELATADINKVDINGDIFGKEGETWKSVGASNTDISALLMDLDFARASSFTATTKAISKNLKWTISIETSKGEKRVFKIYSAESTADYLVSHESTPDLMVIGKKSFEKLESVK